MKKYLFLFSLLLMILKTNAQLKPVAYSDGSQKLNGFAAVPQKPIKDNPGILIYQHGKV